MHQIESKRSRYVFLSLLRVSAEQRKNFIDALAKSSKSKDNWLYFCLKSRSERLENIVAHGNELYAKDHTHMAAAWKNLVHGGWGAETHFLQIDFDSFAREFPEMVTTHPRPSAVAYGQGAGHSRKYLGRWKGHPHSKDYAPTLVQNEYFAGNKTVHGDENTLKPR
jgi:hypothetical protein